MTDQKTTESPRWRPGTYDLARWRGEVMRATPPDVWRQYMDDGYTLRQAVEMELSYAG